MTKFRNQIVNILPRSVNMIDSLPKPAIPQWLESILDNSERNSKFNLSNILTDSLYYPSAGLDGTPVKFLAGNVYSFIFVDYGTNKEDFMCDLTGERGRQVGLQGFLLIGMIKSE